jgi:tetratricopeptide (TPR) repeat protein
VPESVAEVSGDRVKMRFTMVRLFAAWLPAVLGISLLWPLAPATVDGGSQDPAQPAEAPAKGTIAVGAAVVLKTPGTPIFDGGRQVPSDNDLFLTVEETEDDRLLVTSRDGKRRGWVFREQAIPLETAADYFAQALANDHSDVDALWMRARLLLYKNELDLALPSLDKAIRLQPDQARLYVTRGLVHSRRQQPERAIEDCDKAIRLEPRSAQAYVVRAGAWLAKNELDRARADLEQVLRLDHVNPPAPERGAAGADAQGEKNPGEKGAQARPFQADPRTAAELVARGNDLLASREYDDAFADFTEAIKLDPNCAPAFIGRGRVWARKHYRDRELADYSVAIRIEPNNASYRVARGESWSAQGRHDQAMDDYNEALRLDPNNPSRWVSRGNEWRRHLKLDEAVADYTRATQLDPRYIPAYIERGNTYKQRRAFGQAIQEFAGLTRLEPDNPLVHQILARILATCHEPEFRNGRLAVTEATRACELSHWRDPDALDTLAAACAEVGDFTAAVQWQTEALKLIRQHAPSLLQQKASSSGGGQRGLGFEDRLSFYKSRKPTRE